ncbi:mechanosensitive ion channel domain-containing protein [Acidiplasma sp.]|uniref:mechanosensitive ion channel family protein n=1 Tax=Acidiplasma sp. TaxID=1872114 RepID=UPI00258565F8|nr:mechanosensitive ion channel domain-containing protein [Acidiplasma sp.]
MLNNARKSRGELAKIIAEIIIGIILAILAGFVVDFIITRFLPEYKGYEIYINEGVRAVIVLIIGMMITRSTLRFIEYRIKTSRKELYGISLIIRIIMYIIVIAIVLSIFHVSVTGILAGSAVGGVILGLAVQTVASNLIASIFVTSSRTLKYGDVVGINSWVWSIDTTGKIIDVKTLFSKMLTKDNNVISIPNSALLGNSVITEFKTEDSSYIYPLNITTPSDVPADKVIENFKAMSNNNDMTIFLSAKGGTTNTYLIMFKFQDINELNKIISIANMNLDRAYWTVKSQANVLGNNAIYESIYELNYYPVTVILNSDVKSDEILKYVSENHGDLDLKGILMSKSGSTNTYLIFAKIKGPEDINSTINAVNIFMENAYNTLKASQSNQGK